VGLADHAISGTGEAPAAGCKGGVLRPGIKLRLCISEREAMVWVNSRLALRGFAEAFEW